MLAVGAGLSRQGGKKGSTTHAQINDFLLISKLSTMTEAMSVLPRQYMFLKHNSA